MDRSVRGRKQGLTCSYVWWAILGLNPYREDTAIQGVTCESGF
jgi:hypothetical protein